MNLILFKLCSIYVQKKEKGGIIVSSLQKKIFLCLICLCIMSQTLPQVFATDWSGYVETPKSKQIYPVSVQTTVGDVTNANNILLNDGQAVHLNYPAGGTKPYLILNMGKPSFGGHPIFKVTAKTGTPVVRLAYSDWYPTLCETGDFNRGTCTYLGVELPVLPANPYRYELYTVNNPGTVIAPLVQGQEQWVMVQLDTQGTSVDIDYLYLENVHDMSAYAGYFLCNDNDFNRLWFSSTYTAQLASIINADAWTTLLGWLVPRKLEHCNEVGLSVAGSGWTNYSLEFDFIIRKNPGSVSNVGWVLRAQNENNCYVGQIDLNSKLNILKRVNGAYTNLKTNVSLPVTIIDGDQHHVKAVVNGSTIQTYLDNQLVDTTTDSTYGSGKTGFCQPKEKWALVDNVVVKDLSNAVLLSDDFSGSLSAWSFTKTTGFVADGSKRDRLPWLGDLDWAGRNVYYAFNNYSYMRDSIKMFAFNQTPEGFIWAAVYPENTVAPSSGQYGYFQSDEFSAWFVPVVADYLLYTGDTTSVGQVYNAVKKDLDYLWGYVGADGLFNQRYETSKNARNLGLGDTGKYSYMNILLWDALQKGAFIANILGNTTDANTFQTRANTMKTGIDNNLWNGSGYVSKQGNTDFEYTANALALATGFVTASRAATIEASLNDYGHGKFVSLAMRGKLRYFYDTKALTRLRSQSSSANWIGPLNDWRGPSTTWECMTYPDAGAPTGSAWGDKSHPDTAVAHLFSGYVLGVQPTKIGFNEYEAIPHCGDLQWAEGQVPTAHGTISFSWKTLGGPVFFSEDLTAPAGTLGKVGIPKKNYSVITVKVNGQVFRNSSGSFNTVSGIGGGSEDNLYVYATGVQPGTYKFELEASGVPTATPTHTPTPTPTSDGNLARGRPVTARTTYENTDWGTAKMTDGTKTSVTGSKGYTSGADASANTNEWVEIDLGANYPFTMVKLYPRTDTLTAGGQTANFPVDFTIDVKPDGGSYSTVKTITGQANPNGTPQTYDLYTVIGYPNARYLRINATKLGTPASDETSNYRLQFAEVEIFNGGGVTPAPTSTSTATPTPTPAVTPTSTPTPTPVATATPTPMLLSQGKTITSSTNSTGGEPTKANDGNTGTWWCASSAAFPQWLKVNLGAAHPLANVETIFYASETWKYKVEGSNNDSTWTMLKDNTAGIVTGDVTDSISGSYQYVRITVTYGSVDWAAIREFKVNGN
jgi:hypothetical protein